MTQCDSCAKMMEIESLELLARFKLKAIFQANTRGSFDIYSFSNPHVLQPQWAIESDEAAFNACNCNLDYKLRADSAQTLEKFISGTLINIPTSFCTISFHIKALPNLYALPQEESSCM